jgi:hypothetical protein
VCLTVVHSNCAGPWLLGCHAVSVLCHGSVLDRGSVLGRGVLSALCLREYTVQRLRA